jgi:hypothetical protein
LKPKIPEPSSAKTCPGLGCADNIAAAQSIMAHKQGSLDIVGTV